MEAGSILRVKRCAGPPPTAARPPPPSGVSSPHKWPQRPSNRTTSGENDDVLPLQGEVARRAGGGPFVIGPPPSGVSYPRNCALHRQNTVSSAEVASRLTAGASAGDSIPRTPPVFRGELRPPRTPPAGGLLRTSPWTPYAGPVPSDDSSQGSTAGAWSRAGCRVWASMGSGDDESKGRHQIRRFVRWRSRSERLGRG